MAKKSLTPKERQEAIKQIKDLATSLMVKERGLDLGGCNRLILPLFCLLTILLAVAVGLRINSTFEYLVMGIGVGAAAAAVPVALYLFLRPKK